MAVGLVEVAGPINERPGAEEHRHKAVHHRPAERHKEEVKGLHIRHRPREKRHAAHDDGAVHGQKHLELKVAIHPRVVLGRRLQDSQVKLAEIADALVLHHLQ